MKKILNSRKQYIYCLYDREREDMQALPNPNLLPQ